jgi:excinuclease UvrABC nuclease subunit
LNFRPIVGDPGDRYPEWIAAVDGKSGIYVIKSKRGIVLYVGESHTGRLKATLVRHFQQWKRDKLNLYSKTDWSRTTGKTYDRSDVLVWVHPCRKDQAQKLQYLLIQKLQPRDNHVDGSGELGDLSEVPF